MLHIADNPYSLTEILSDSYHMLEARAKKKGLSSRFGFRIFTRSRELVGYHACELCWNFAHDSVLALTHHVVLQAALQEFGEHLVIVSSRAISFADRGVYIALGIVEIILQSKLRQQLDVVLREFSGVA